MRMQLALNVDDLGEAIDFYTKMFDAAPAKVKPGYANWAIADPPLKLVVFEQPGAGGSINHLGVETETAEQVVAAEARIAQSGIDTTGVDDTLCCYASKTETWVEGAGSRWEWYVKTGDADEFENVLVTGVSDTGEVQTAEGTCCN